MGFGVNVGLLFVVCRMVNCVCFLVMFEVGVGVVWLALLFCRGEGWFVGWWICFIFGLVVFWDAMGCL